MSEYPTQPNEVCQGLISDVGCYHQRQEIPVQEIVFLGLAISTLAMQVTLPKEKMAHVQQEAKTTAFKGSTEGHSFVGMTTAAKQAIRMAPLFHRHLQALINGVVPLASTIEEVKQSYYQTINISTEAKEELRWWMQEAQNNNGAPISMVHPTW